MQRSHATMIIAPGLVGTVLTATVVEPARCLCDPGASQRAAHARELAAPLDGG